MLIKNILKALSLSLVTSFVLASETNDCKEINEYLSKIYESTESIIGECQMNEQGKIIELKVNNYELQEEDVNKILSYDTIKELNYVVGFHADEATRSIIQHPGYSKFPLAITKLPELENLSFDYANNIRYQYSSYYKRDFIAFENDYLNLSKKLKKLTLSQVILNNQNINEISALANLEELNLYYCSYDSNYLNSLGNHKNLSKLGISGDFPKNINKLKSLKEIKIEDGYCKEPSYDFNGLDNLETLYLELEEACDFDMSNLSKLSELSIIGEDHVFSGPGVESPVSLKMPSNLKSLDLSIPLSSDNFKAIASLPNLEKLNLGHRYSDDDFNITSLKCHDKLNQLVAHLNKDSVEILNDLVNLTYLDISGSEIKEIHTLENLKKLEYINLNSNLLSEFPSQLTTLINLKHIDLSYNEISQIPKEIANLKNLEFLNLSNNQISQLPEEFGELKNLKELTLSGNQISEIPEGILNFKNLENLFLSDNQLTQLPDDFGKLENLKFLKIDGNKLTKFPKQIGNLKKLENLFLMDNKIDDEIPESYNNLTELRNFEGYYNNIRGKILQNEKLEYCGYSKTDNENPCRTGNEKCQDDDLPLCADSSTKSTTTTTENSTTTEVTTTKTTTTTTTNSKPTIKGQCGKGIGKCKSGYCCSKHGWCGKTDEYCAVSQGCQSEFGDCKASTTTTVKTTTTTTTVKPTIKGKCGKGIGKCKSGYCCSKYGWCGKTDEYCAVSQGCQSEFGDCKASTTTTVKTTTTTTTVKPTIEGQCGKGIGKCKSGYCCSKHGWCGKTDEYCAVSKGCQSEFGDCKASTTTTVKTTTTTTTVQPTAKGRCGEGIGSCPTGYCCSKYGWCGKSSSHCDISKGCQSQFGHCTKDQSSIEGKCGEGYGKCPSGYCCSKYGWCGKTDSYCAASMGCQSKFGKCN